MNRGEIDKLLEEISLHENQFPELIETHISWVILCNKLVLKIKKPIKYSFLDFSTLKQRKFYCERELELNNRLTTGVYLGVVAIVKNENRVYVEGNTTVDNIIDYAVKMNKLNPEKRMDLLLKNGRVDIVDVKTIAETLIPFHKNARTFKAVNIASVAENFNDLKNVLWKENYTRNYAKTIISESIAASNAFIFLNKELFLQRAAQGFVVDGHGDLHARNIFLLPAPVIFDCIEFNDKLRQIDVLNELAFFCMDLEANGRIDLSNVFFDFYNHNFCICRSEQEYRLFVYYKAYRANIRAKVNMLRANSVTDGDTCNKALSEAMKYLKLMKSYYKSLVQI